MTGRPLLLAALIMLSLSGCAGGYYERYDTYGSGYYGYPGVGQQGFQRALLLRAWLARSGLASPSAAEFPRTTSRSRRSTEQRESLAALNEQHFIKNLAGVGAT